MYRAPQKFDNQIPPKKKCQKKVTFSKSSCRVSMWVFVDVLISLICLRSACLFCYSLPSICSCNLQVPGNVPPHFLDIISSYKSYRHYSGRQGLWILHQSTQQPLFKAWTSYLMCSDSSFWQNAIKPPGTTTWHQKGSHLGGSKASIHRNFNPCLRSFCALLHRHISVYQSQICSKKNINKLTLKKASAGGSMVASLASKKTRDRILSFPAIMAEVIWFSRSEPPVWPFLDGPALPASRSPVFWTWRFLFSQNQQW